MFKSLKKVYQFLKEKTVLSFDLIRKKGRDLFQGLFNKNMGKNKSNYLVNMLANALVGKGLDKYLKSLKPPMPLLSYDPAIKSMKIEWNTRPSSMDYSNQIKERLEEQIINKYVRYVSRHIFVFLQANKHKILLNATAFGESANYQINVGNQLLYKNPGQLEDYLIDNLMGVLVSYEANGLEDFTYFISNIDDKLYEELSIKIRKLFQD